MKDIVTLINETDHYDPGMCRGTLRRARDEIEQLRVSLRLAEGQLDAANNQMREWAKQWAALYKLMTAHQEKTPEELPRTSEET
jgi:hypothetical protein